MNLIMMIYLILGIFSVFAGVLIISIISGKSIIMDFKRMIVRKGCDVYIANSNRNITHYYRVPKKDAFKIDGQTYITNPEKTLNLNSYDKMKVISSIARFEKRIKTRVEEIEKRIIYLEGVVKSLEEAEEDTAIYRSEIIKLKDTQKLLQDKVKQKLNNYFYGKRPAYFYTEGDPVPKDLHEYLTDQDAVILDNLVSRSMSQPVNLKQHQKQLDMLRIISFIIVACVLIALVITFKNASSIMKICENLGVVC